MNDDQRPAIYYVCGCIDTWENPKYCDECILVSTTLCNVHKEEVETKKETKKQMLAKIQELKKEISTFENNEEDDYGNIFIKGRVQDTVLGAQKQLETYLKSSGLSIDVIKKAVENVEKMRTTTKEGVGTTLTNSDGSTTNFATCTTEHARVPLPYARPRSLRCGFARGIDADI